MKKYNVTKQELQAKLRWWKERRKEAERAKDEILMSKSKKFDIDRFHWESAIETTSRLIIADIQDILNILDDEFEAPFET